jgi:hypothetical protein
VSVPVDAWLRGQAWLLAGTLLIAVCLGAGIAGHRAFFEGLVQEKYGPPAASTSELAARLERGTSTAEELAGLGAAARADLYVEWMTRTTASADSALPRALMAIDAEYFRRRVEMTLAGGTGIQRERALLFVRASRDPRFEAVLGWAVRRAREVGDDRFESAALAATAQSPGRAASPRDLTRGQRSDTPHPRRE